MIQDLVGFAEEYASARGLKPAFHIATNGTLLDESKIQFLVEHGFNVSISLDGPREVHDRYRVFRHDGRADGRVGSYDVVMKNIERFVHLYPDYVMRGLSVTITATSDFGAIDDVLRRLQLSFPVILENLVRDVRGCEPLTEGAGSCHMGAPWAPPSRASDESVNDMSPTEGTVSTGDQDGELSQGSSSRGKHQPSPTFCDWSQGGAARLHALSERFVHEACDAPSNTDLAARCPSSCALFRRGLMKIHERHIASRPPMALTTYRCFPGAARTFCSTDGTLYPCERTDASTLFELGNAQNGIDLQRSVRLTELARLAADCGNCVAKRMCAICPAVLSERERSGMVDASALHEECKSTIVNTHSRLQEYATIMEAESTHRDAILGLSGESDDWLDDVTVVLTEQQQQSVKEGIRQVDEWL